MEQICANCGSKNPEQQRHCSKCRTILGPLAKGRIFAGRYRIDSLRGKGNMGYVFHAYDTRLGRHLALKTLLFAGIAGDKRRENLQKRLLIEARAQARLGQHPHIVNIYDTGFDQDIQYIAMELIDGRDVNDYLDRGERLPVARVVAMVRDICSALAFAHQNNIIHRDIKPSNIMVTRDGITKVADFGIAKILDSEMTNITKTGRLVGTPNYMSPEQVLGKPLDGRSDIFSLGCIFYKLLALQSPFPGDTAIQAMGAILNNQPIPVSQLNPQVDERLGAIVMRCLQKERSRRYQSASELQEVLSNLPAEPKKAPSRPAQKQSSRIFDTKAAPRKSKRSAASAFEPSREATEIFMEMEGKQALPRAGGSSRFIKGMVLVLALAVIGLGGYIAVHRLPKKPAHPTEPVKDQPAQGTAKQNLRARAEVRAKESAAKANGRISRTPGAEKPMAVDTLEKPAQDESITVLELEPQPREKAPTAEEIAAKAYTRIQDSSKEAEWKTFYSQYKDTSYGPKAKARLETIRQTKARVQEMESAWAKAKQTDSLSAYQAFIERYERESFAATRLAQARMGLNALKQATNRDKNGLAKPTPGCYLNPDRIWERKLTIGGQTFYFVYVPAGTFTMGHRDKEKPVLKGKVGAAFYEEYFADEKPKHVCRLSRAVWLSKTEITIAQFQAFVIATGYRTDAEAGRGKLGKGSIVLSGERPVKQADAGWRKPYFSQGDDHPVVCVSWNDCQQMIQWLRNTSGQPFRLPTEAEWEYACRAGTDTSFFWGNNYAKTCVYANGADKATQAKYAHWAVNDCSDGHGETAPVGSFTPNAWGLYDMSGNVWEWCNDWYGETYYAGSPGRDPTGPSSGTDRVNRGGGWNNLPMNLRSAYRDNCSPDYRISNLGFRLALPVQ